MKQAMIDYVQNPKNDELYTPPEAIKPLLPYIDPTWDIWEPTDPGHSKITQMLRDKGISCIGTSFDFLRNDLEQHYDAIITNPPYSLKDQFLQRCYELRKPFALLLPITALEGVNRGKLYRKYGVQLLVLDKRINFIPDKKGSWFNVSWFTWKTLPRDLIFKEVEGGGSDDNS